MPLSQNLEAHELLLRSEEQGKPSDMGQEETYLKVEVRDGDGIARYGVLGGTAVLLLTTWITVFSNNPTSSGWFALHPLLQTLAMSLFTYGILTLQPTSQPKTKAAGLARHQLAILFIGFPSIVFGTLAVSYNKYLKDANHFTTWHGKLGLLSMIWLFAQIGLGAGSVWFGGAAFGGGAKAKAVWKYHRLSGYILFPLLIATVHLGGGWSNWGVEYTAWGIRVLTYTFAPFAILAGVYARIRFSKMQFL